MRLIHLRTQLPGSQALYDFWNITCANLAPWHASELSAAELLLRTRLARETKAKLVEKVGWDRTELLARKPSRKG